MEKCNYLAVRKLGYKSEVTTKLKHVTETFIWIGGVITRSWYSMFIHNVIEYFLVNMIWALLVLWYLNTWFKVLFR
jgi:hypothetical protein